MGLTLFQCILNRTSDFGEGANGDWKRKGKATLREMKPVCYKAEGQGGGGELHTWMRW